jgi:hypothetical protein
MMASMTTKIAANPAQGVSFGLDHPFMYRQEDPEHWIVYQRKDGLIVASFDGTEAFPGTSQNLDQSQRKFWAQELAYRECIRRNSPGSPDLAAIDITP